MLSEQIFRLLGNFYQNFGVIFDFVSVFHVETGNGKFRTENKPCVIVAVFKFEDGVDDELGDKDVVRKDPPLLPLKLGRYSNGFAGRW